MVQITPTVLRRFRMRMSQDMLFQLGGVGLSVALRNSPDLANKVIRAYGLTAHYGMLLPFGRKQESEADRIGMILMAKAGYDPKVALRVWENMEKKDKVKGAGSPPEFLSTHPGYETRTRQLQLWIPEAIKYYRSSMERIESLPKLHHLETPLTRMEREMFKRIQSVNRKARSEQGQRSVVQALGYILRIDPAHLFQERQQLRLGYGQHAALRGLAWLGYAPLRQVRKSYDRGLSWSELSRTHGTRIAEILTFMRRLLLRIAKFRSRR